MKTILLIIVIIIFGCPYCFSQQDSALPVTVNIKLDKEYEVKPEKAAYSREAMQSGYVINSDSVTQKFYDITITIKNTCDNPIKIWMMTCSWEENFLVNNNYMFMDLHMCNSNFPAVVEIKAGESKEYKTTLLKSIKFDYPCQYCIYGPQVETTKLGLIIIDDVFNKKLGMFGYHMAMEDKSKWRIVWSNPMYLFGKQPEPVKFEVLKPD